MPQAGYDRILQFFDLPSWFAVEFKRICDTKNLRGLFCRCFPILDMLGHSQWNSVQDSLLFIGGWSEYFVSIVDIFSCHLIHLSRILFYHALRLVKSSLL